MPRTLNFNTIIKEAKCAKCGKVFIPAIYHRFKEGNKYYCTWTCYNHRYDEETTPKENFLKTGAKNEK